MKRIMLGVFALAAAFPLAAGSLQGKVTLKGLSNNSGAVVYVDRIPGKSFPAPAAHARMNQESLMFAPHVLAVQEGTTVDFLNSDAVQHNVFSPTACAGKMNLGPWPTGQTRSHTFTKECFVTLLCLIHPQMLGYVAVLPTPYFAVTAADGSYSIPNVPDGSYTVKVWHPKLHTAPVKETVKGATQANFTLSR